VSDNWSEQEKDLVDSLIPFNCVKGAEYNQLASLFVTDSDTAIRQLFHFRESEVSADILPSFQSGDLFVFFASYISMAVVVYGM
jgi:hypothetical protein